MCGESLPVSAAIVLGLLVALTTSQSPVPSQPTVTVDQGVLFGVTETFQEDEFIGVTRDIDVFRGIPFAEPPVGPLRFKPPVEKSSWDGAYNATFFRDACVQESRLGLQTSEDCLHLNIYAPNPKIPEGAAVMVWIHGGSFTIGSGNQPDYNGKSLVATGNVIVVAINYRLNIFGFLTTGDEASPGNAGLQDQALALKWIKQNIAAFGGDSERITIFGESAGSASVSLLVLSKKTEGLFNQAIMQSGTALSPFAFYENKDEMRQQVFQIGEKLGCSAADSTALVNCLREQDPTALLSTGLEVLFRTTSVVDGDFLEDTPSNLYISGRYNHAKLLLGTNADEGTLFLVLDPQFAEYYIAEDAPFISRAMFEQGLSKHLTLYYGSSHVQTADAIKSRYIDWSQADYEDADYFRSLVDLQTDFEFACPTDQVARFHAQGGDDVFMYQMTHIPSVSIFSVGEFGPGWTGAGHAEDIIYVFGLSFIPEVAATRHELQDSEKALSVKFMEFWTNFAKTGNPGLKTPGSQPDSEDDFWPEFTIPELRYKELNLNMTTGRALKSNECHFWNTYLVQLQTMLADLDVTEREWRQSFYSWKYTDMADWRDEFNQYKSITGN